MTGGAAPQRPAPIEAADAPFGTRPPVDLFGIRFPRLQRAEARQWLVARVDKGATTALCFPDMSTLNLVARRPDFGRLIRERFVAWNDGVGLEIAARLRGRPFPANLNGTDLVPDLLRHVAPGTTLYVLGARPGVAERASAIVVERFPAVCVVGHHHGYLDESLERGVIDELRRVRPRIVMVGMGHPLQVEFIARHVGDPALAATTWLAVGGQLDYYGATLRRAPAWMIRARLEWLHLMINQPHKARRYLLGAPAFLARFAWAQLRRRHDLPAAT